MRNDPEEVDDPFLPFDAVALGMHELYASLVRAGFTPEQAMALMLKQMELRQAERLAKRELPD